MDLELTGEQYPVTAQRINALHAEMTGHMVMAVKKAIEVGRLLTEQKQQLAHGEWIPWVESNLTFGRFQASKYMRVYDRRDQLNVYSDTHLKSIDQAVALLAEPREQPEPVEDSDELGIDMGMEDPEKQVVYERDPEQEKQLEAAAKRAAIAEAKLTEAEQRLSSIEKSYQDADRKLASQLSELERLRKLDADKKRVEETLANIHQLEKRKQDLFADAESTKLVHQVLVRSREFFTKECMQIPALKLRPESIQVMRPDFEGLVDLVENWLDAIKERFL